MEIQDASGIIAVMPEHLANKIAAGEVVQRPASAIKEMMENSLDAGADQITVIIKKAGAELMQVIDNGCGMSQEDAITCFLRHATSKIRSVEDLEKIRTLGFRGEALASIAAVAQVELRTKRVGDEAGVCVRVEASHFHDPFPIATPNGSSMAVKNLFYNVPARRNFLKSPATEFKRIVEVFQFLALANPDVGFNLVHDDREIYRLAGRDDSPEGLQQRIADLFEVKSTSLIHVQDEVSHLSIQGFTSKPEFTRKARGEQFLFVNKRYIKSHKLDQAVMMGYGEMLPKGAYPFFALFLEIDPIHVDVNVHPTKTEVQFDDESGLFGFVRGAVKRALGGNDITPFVGYDAQGKLIEREAQEILARNPEMERRLHTSPPTKATNPAASKLPNLFRGDAKAPANHPRPDASPYVNYQKAADELYGHHNSSENALPSIPAASYSQSEREPWEQPEDSTQSAAPVEENLAPVWQIHDKYVLTQIESGMMMMDMHAAHERILYEKILRGMEAGEAPSQQLLFPHTIEFSVGDFELVNELLPDLRSMGFSLEPMSGRAYLVAGVPTDVPAGNEDAILHDLLEQYKEYRDTLQIKGRDNLAKSLSCHAAVRTGKRLTVAEMRQLTDDLFRCEMPYACPHGRPTMIKITLDELDKRFGRIGHLETSGTVKRG